MSQNKSDRKSLVQQSGTLTSILESSLSATQQCKGEPIVKKYNEFVQSQQSIVIDQVTLTMNRDPRLHSAQGQ